MCSSHGQELNDRDLLRLRYDEARERPQGRVLGMTGQSLRLMDVDHKMAADPDGRLLRELGDRFTMKKQSLRQALDAGVAPGDYASYQALHAAYEAGSQLLPILWNQQNVR